MLQVMTSINSWLQNKESNLHGDTLLPLYNKKGKLMKKVESSQIIERPRRHLLKPGYQTVVRVILNDLVNFYSNSSATSGLSLKRSGGSPSKRTKRVPNYQCIFHQQIIQLSTYFHVALSLRCRFAYSLCYTGRHFRSCSRLLK